MAHVEAWKKDTEEQTSLAPMKSVQSHPNDADLFLHTAAVNRQQRGGKQFHLQWFPTSQLIPEIQEEKLSSLQWRAKGCPAERKQNAKVIHVFPF